MKKMKKILSTLVAVTVLLTAGITQSKAQSTIPFPGTFYRADYKQSTILIKRIATSFAFALLHAGLPDMVQEHFPDEPWVDSKGRLHLPEGGTLFNLTTGRDETAAFRRANINYPPEWDEFDF